MLDLVWINCNWIVFIFYQIVITTTADNLHILSCHDQLNSAFDCIDHHTLLDRL